MTDQIIVYSKPVCMQCRMTYTALDARGINYRIVDLTEDPEAYLYVTEDLGYLQAPIVVLNDQEHWSGFRPDLIDKIAS